MGSFPPTSFKVSSVLTLPVIPPKTVSGRVTSAQIKMTNITDEKGRAAVELRAQAILFNNMAVMKRAAGNREAVTIMLRAHLVPPRYL